MIRDYELTPFNSSLETGIRSLAILYAGFPNAFDLQRLIEMDYLVVHSGDVDGPESLHIDSPLRAGELIVRRGLVEKGLILMMSRGLVKRLPNYQGFGYIANESAAPFMNSLTDEYSVNLKDRAAWVFRRFANLSTDEIRRFTSQIFARWTVEFQSAKKAGDEL